MDESEKSKLLRRAKRNARSVRLKLSTSSEEDDRIRTPSGTEIIKKVSDIRAYFSTVSQDSHSEHKVLKNCNTLDYLDLSASVSSCQSNRNKSDTLTSSVYRKGRRGVKRQINNANSQNKCDSSSVCQQIEEGNSSSEESQGFHTPGLEQSVKESADDETVFLYQLAKMLKPVSEGENATTPNKSDQGNSSMQQSKQSTTAEEFNSEDRMETNDEDNPQIMSVSTVVRMISNLKSELTEARKKDNEDLKQSLKSEISKLKADCVSDCVKELKKDTTQDTEEFQKMQAEVAYWKIKAETIAEVCNRMSTEITDLTTRVENLEVNNSKKMVIITGLYMENLKYKSDRNSFFKRILQ